MDTLWNGVLYGKPTFLGVIYRFTTRHINSSFWQDCYKISEWINTFGIRCCVFQGTLSGPSFLLRLAFFKYREFPEVQRTSFLGGNLRGFSE
jgi:hypothetical protein